MLDESEVCLEQRWAGWDVWVYSERKKGNRTTIGIHDGMVIWWEKCHSVKGCVWTGGDRKWQPSGVSDKWSL